MPLFIFGLVNFSAWLVAQGGCIDKGEKDILILGDIMLLLNVSYFHLEWQLAEYM